MNGVPIIASNDQDILILPMIHSTIPMRNNLEETESKGFVIKNSRIKVGRILFLDTKCSGKFCDCQDVLLNINKLCGCFSLKSSRSKIISIHSIFFTTGTSETKMICKFISLKLLETFSKGNLLVDI